MTTIRLNGEEYECEGEHLAALLTEISAPPRGIAVECNGVIIPKSNHAEYRLNEGDQVEVIGFIGGG